MKDSLNTVEVLLRVAQLQEPCYALGATHGMEGRAENCCWKRVNDFQLFSTGMKRDSLPLCKRYCLPWLFGEMLTLSEWKGREK